MLQCFRTGGVLTYPMDDESCQHDVVIANRFCTADRSSEPTSLRLAYHPSNVRMTVHINRLT